MFHVVSVETRERMQKSIDFDQQLQQWQRVSEPAAGSLVISSRAAGRAAFLFYPLPEELLD